MVEFQPSKLAMRVRFPLPAPLIVIVLEMSSTVAFFILQDIYDIIYSNKCKE